MLYISILVKQLYIKIETLKNNYENKNISARNIATYVCAFLFI